MMMAIQGFGRHRRGASATGVEKRAESREPGRVRGGRRTLALGLALLAALAAPPVLAQTAVTLVSNTDQTVGAASSNRFQAQSFGTGDNTAGYTLTSIEVRLTDTASKSTSVTVRENNASDEPGDLVATLTSPTSLVDDSFNTFTVPSGTTVTLDATTTYWVSVNEGISSDRATLSQTSSNDETGESGWTIGNSRLNRTSETNSWTEVTAKLMIKVNGTINSLVSNTGQTNSSAQSIGTNDVAQAIETGSDSAGYNLESVALSFGSVDGTDTLTVTVHEDSAGDPSATVLYTLTNPGSITEHALNTFTAPAGATLNGSSTYWVVASYDSTSSISWWRTLLSNGIDTGGAAGWDISKAFKIQDRVTPAGWSVPTALRALKLQIRGSAKTISTNTPATGAPGITGTPQVAETLTATVGDMADTEGLPTTAFPTGYTFQWVLDDAGTETDISGATSQTYVPVAADAGKTIKVEVTFTDGGGTSETLASVATQPVAGAKTACPTHNEWCTEMESGYSVVTGVGLTVETIGYDSSTSFGALGDPVGFSHAGTDYTVTLLEGTAQSGLLSTNVFNLNTGAELPDGAVLTLNGTALTVGADSDHATVGAESWDLDALGIDFDWVEGTKVTTSLNFPPKLTTATVNGTSLVLTYHENLDTTSVPALAQYTVKKTPSGGTEEDVDLDGSPTISGTQVTLTLDEAVVSTDGDVKVSYAVPASSPLQDLSGLDASAETDYPVTNNTGTPMNNAPVFDDGTSTSRDVAENTTSGTDFGGAVSATDADTSDTLTYSLEGTDAASFGINSGTGQLKTSAALNHEMKSSYSVRVKVVDGNGGSDTIDVTINVTDENEQPARPGAPTVNAKTGTTDQLDVSWSEPGLNGGPDITGYELQYRTTIGTPSWTPIASTMITGRTHTIGSLSANTEYEVQVKALNGETPSAWSLSGTATTGAANSAPVFDDGTSTSRSVAENTATNTDFGGAVSATDADTNDTLTYSLEGADATSFGINSGTGQLKTSAALNHEMKSSYSVRVKVVDGNNGSDTIAVTINVTDLNEQPLRPGAPSVNGKAGTTDELEVSWSKPGLNGGPEITGYLLRFRVPGGTWSERTPSGINRTYTIDGLSANTAYEVQVKAQNGETDSAWSPSGTATTGTSQPAVSFSASSYTATEGGAAATVTVRLSRTPDAQVTIPIARSNRGGASNADYSGVPSSVTFGTSNTTRSFTVTATDDDEDDPGERVQLSFGTLPAGVVAGQPSTASVNIVDNDTDTDTARVTFDAGSTGANEQAGAAPVRLRLTDRGGATLRGGLERAVSVPLTVTHIGGATAADYEPLPASVTFAVGESETMLRVVPVNDDDDDDGEAVRLGLGPLPAGLSPGAHPTKLVRLVDDDGIDTWYVSFERAGYTAAEGGAVRIAVVLSDPWKPWLNRSLTIPLQVSAHGGGATPGDYSGVPQSVTIPAGATRATFTVRAVDDTDDDGGESVTLAMRWQRFPDDLSAGRGPIETVVSLADDDGATPVEVSFGSAAYTAVEGGSSATVQVRLDRAPGREVQVPLTTTRRGASSADFSGVPGSVVFGAAQTVRSFTVTATDDSDDDDGESLDIGFGTLPDAVTAGSPASATVQLEDDDGPVARYEVRFDTRSSLVRNVHEGGCFWTGAALYPVGPLGAAPETSLALPLTATHLRGATAADYSDLPANLVFEAGETRSGFSVCAVDDAEEDPGEGLIVRFGALPAGVSGMRDRDAATFNIVDNDGPPGVSIGDATVRERRGSTYSRLIFTLTLDRRADVESSVRWRTVDGTATAGEDYVAASGTATIRSGNNWTQIKVDTIYDEVAEGDETMTVVLSNPQALRLVDATGTGTILDARATVGVADAFVTGAQLTLRFAEALDAGSTPGPKDWVVRAESRAGARTLAVTAVAVRGTDATLTLGTPAQPAETVTMTYLPWAMHPLRASPDGPEAAPLTELPVRNETGRPPDGANRNPGTLPAPSLDVLPGESAASAPGRLDLSDRGLADIASLAGLTELDALDLSGNALADVSALVALSNLRRLDLSGNRVADTAPLAALAGLEVLDLSGNALSDVSALAALSNLRRLDLSGNRVADTAPLAALAGLEVLDLSGNALSDVSALAALSNLRRLDLSGNALADVTALVGLADLEVLVLDGNAIADPGPLGQLPRLARLGLSANRVSEVALLTGLASLERLDLSGNRIALPAPLGELSGLMWLDLRANPLSDVSPLGYLEQLRWLWLDPRAPGLGALAPLTQRPAPLRLDSGPPAQSDATR